MSPKTIFTAVILFLPLQVMGDSERPDEKATYTKGQIKAEQSMRHTDGFDNAVPVNIYYKGKPYVMKATDVVNAQVKNEQGHVVGEVRDIVVKRKSQLLKAVVKLKERMDVEHSTVTIPYEQLRISTFGHEEPTVYLNTAAFRLENAEPWNPDRMDRDVSQRND